jgi:hypothetical protein
LPLRGARGWVARYANERRALWLFVAVLTAYRATQWGRFAVPAPDFFDFEHTAQALAAGHLPAQFQRAPVYPALIAVISPLVGGARPTLAAAQGINLAMMAAALLIMYELCALFVGRWALLAAALSGLHWTMAYVTIHPLCEPTLLAAVLAALYLDAAERPGKYVAASLAAATRYEGLFLVAALAFCDLRRRRNALRVLLAAGFALLPGAAWLLLGLLRAANPYADALAAQTPAGLEFLRSMAMSAIGVVPLQVLEGALAGRLAAWAVAAPLAAAVAGLAAVGAYRAVMRYRRTAPPLLLFGAGYTAVHLLYPAANTRFVLPVLWLVHLLAVMGGTEVAQRVRARYPVGLPLPGLTTIVSVAGAVAMAALAVWAARYDSLWVLPLAAPVAVGLFAPGGRIRALAAAPAIACIGLVVAGALGLSGWYVEREARWWAELAPVKQWCERQPPGSVHLAATHTVIGMMRELRPRARLRFYDLARLDPSGPAAPPPEVTHLLWCSTDAPLPGGRLRLLLSRRYADGRERRIATGVWFARRVATGRDARWRACARFEAGGQQAAIYARADAHLASAAAQESP